AYPMNSADAATNGDAERRGASKLYVCRVPCAVCRVPCAVCLGYAPAACRLPYACATRLPPAVRLRYAPASASERRKVMVKKRAGRARYHSALFGHQQRMCPAAECAKGVWPVGRVGDEVAGRELDRRIRRPHESATTGQVDVLDRAAL